MGSVESILIPSEREKNQFRVSPTDWMGYVADDVQLSDMSIPGTHQSCSILELAMPRCQTTSISEQLEGGIRFLDIRVKQTADGLLVHHGPVYQLKCLFDVLADCELFLEDHPTESILMSLKGNEDRSNVNALPFSQVFAKEVDKGGSGLWSRFYSGCSIPTLGEVRGKIVLLKRTEATSAPCGGIIIDEFGDGEHTNHDGIE
jgi:1-phosphatidylinositol phosphodiesterase